MRGAASRLGPTLAALYLVTAGAGVVRGASAAPRSSCETCHAGLADVAPELVVKLDVWDLDVHAAKGLGCVGCHGGNPDPAVAGDAEAAMSKAAGFVGKPERSRQAEWCGRCHSDPEFMRRFQPRARIDQVTEYRSSVHGKRNQQGDATVATCVDCHSVHGLLPVSNPNSPVYALNVPRTCARCHADAVKMAPYGIATDQYAKYTASVHGIALLKRQDTAAPACNDCHGNHGAVPPGVNSVTNVCGTCHAREAELFRGSKKAAAFDQLGLPECMSCHGSHEVPRPSIVMLAAVPETPCDICHSPGDPPGFADERASLLAASQAAGATDPQARFDWLVDRAKQRHHSAEFDELFLKFRVGKIGETSSRCADCHAPGDAGYTVAAGFSKDQQELTRLAAHARRKLLSAERAGMEVGEASFQLGAVVDAEISLEVLVHSFDHSDPGQFAQTYRRGAEGGRAVLEQAEGALRELSRRRAGLAVAVALILLVTVGLGLWIREIERSPHPT
jgi:hypothetical protein